MQQPLSIEGGREYQTWKNSSPKSLDPPQFSSHLPMDIFGTTSLLFSIYTTDLFSFGSFPWRQICLFSLFTAEFQNSGFCYGCSLETKFLSPFKYRLVTCSQRTSFRQTAYTDNTLSEDWQISISMPLQFNPSSGVSLLANTASVLFVHVATRFELYFFPVEVAINFKSRAI